MSLSAEWLRHSAATALTQIGGRAVEPHQPGRTITLDPEITAVTVCAGGGDPDGQVSVGFELSIV